MLWYCNGVMDNYLCASNWRLKSGCERRKALNEASFGSTLNLTGRSLYVFIQRSLEPKAIWPPLLSFKPRKSKKHKEMELKKRGARRQVETKNHTGYRHWDAAKPLAGYFQGNSSAFFRPWVCARFEWNLNNACDQSTKKEERTSSATRMAPPNN